MAKKWVVIREKNGASGDYCDFLAPVDDDVGNFVHFDDCGFLPTAFEKVAADVDFYAFADCNGAHYAMESYEASFLIQFFIFP